MYLVKIDEIIADFGFKTKKEALVFIIDELNRKNFDDPIDILKKCKKEKTDHSEILTVDETIYTISKLYEYRKCCLCEEPMKSCDELRCKHSVCKDCLYKLRKNECPVCRSVLSGEIITDILIAHIFQNLEDDKFEEENRNRLAAIIATMGFNANEFYE